MYISFYKGNFNSLSFSTYESPYDDQSVLQDYDFVYCYGNVSQKDIDSIIPHIFAHFQNEFLSFLNSGGVFVISDDFGNMARELFNYSKKDYEFGVGGFTIEAKRYGKPVICINLNGSDGERKKSGLVDAAIHEMAHYIDNRGEFSATDEFKTYFSQYSEDYKPQSNVAEGYQKENAKEFFAILYTDTITSPNLNMPDDLYQYMKAICDNR